MAKSFIDVVQDSPRTGLGIPAGTKKPPLSNQYTARETRPCPRNALVVAQHRFRQSHLA